jgi:hypothetical protein
METIMSMSDTESRVIPAAKKGGGKSSGKGKGKGGGKRGC